MSSIYRKSGETVRVEQIRSVSASLRIREGGVCEWGGTLFRSRAIPADRDFSLEETAVESVARQIRGIVAPPVEIERMTLVCGAAQHELSEQGESRRWEDRSTRLHLSLIERSRRLRATIDLGAPAIEDIDLIALDRLTRTLALPSAPIPGGAIDLALSPNVAAAVVPAILLHPELSRVGPLGGRFQIFQRSSSALDGRGEPIEERLLYDGEKGVVARSWPNVYRPSYRTLPSAAPFNVELSTGFTPRDAGWSASALSEPIRREGGNLIAAVLLHDHARNGCFEAVISLELRQWIEKLESGEGQRRWFPYAAGSLGTWSSLAGVSLRAPAG